MTKTAKKVKTANTAKRKAQSPILEAVHETAAGFHQLGFIDKRKMQEYDALCLKPIPDSLSNSESAVNAQTYQYADPRN